MSKRIAVALIVAGLAGASLGAGAMAFVRAAKQARITTVASKPVWTEVKWPFVLDQWGSGKAFRCAAADCGSEVRLYVRAKIGFCNCAVGVADDEELERVSDFELFASGKAPVGEGRPIKVGAMKGRSRGYLTAQPFLAPTKSFLTIAYNERCDLIAATVVMQHDQPNALETRVLAFLETEPVINWVSMKLGL